MIDARQCQASRAILAWAVATRRMIYQEYNALIRDVSERERILHGCEGKTAFPSFEAANAVATRPSHHGHRHRKVFHCAACSKWHLASIHPQARTMTLRFKARKNGMNYA